MNACPVCDTELSIGLRPWHLICATCGYEGSNLHINILGQKPGGNLDEPARAIALGSLRRANFERILREIGRRMPQRASSSKRPRMLEVGSAHGWFLELARDKYAAVGIEPDKEIISSLVSKCLPVRQGFFPEVLDADERFDVIVFNDVLEHIPDLNATMEACTDHLLPGGLLVVNAPNRDGFMYWLSKQLLRLGKPRAFERLWQVGFPSPHLHFLDSASVGAVAARYGLRQLSAHRLTSVSCAGLYSRIRYAGDVSSVKAAFLTLAISAAVPVLAVLPADIKVWVFAKRRPDGQPPANEAA